VLAFFEEVFDAVKLIGALGGLASSAFLVYDRLYRYRPIVFLCLADFKVNIQIKNTAEETIVIDEILVRPSILTVARANDLITKNEERQMAFYPSSADKDGERFQGNFVVVKPLAERMFPLHRLGAFESADGRTRIKIRVHWYNTRKPWPLRRYTTIRTTVKRVRSLQDAAYTGKV
jgi:hypothetical protein